MGCWLPLLGDGVLYAGDVYTFHVRSQTWTLSSAAAAAGCRPVPVRHCAAAAPTGDSLVVIGGGAQCFSFGTTFSRPCVLHLPRSCPAATASQKAANSSSACNGIDTSEGAPVAEIGAASPQQSASTHHTPAEVQENGLSTQDTYPGRELNKSCRGSTEAENKGQNGEKGSWALVVPKQEAKGFKDALKSAQGLNRQRRSLVCDGGASIALPITDACAHSLVVNTGLGEGSSHNGKELGALRTVAEAMDKGRVKVEQMPLAEAKVPCSPREALIQAAQDLLSKSGITPL